MAELAKVDDSQGVLWLAVKEPWVAICLKFARS